MHNYLTQTAQAPKLLDGAKINIAENFNPLRAQQRDHRRQQRHKANVT